MAISDYIRHKMLNPTTWGRSTSCAIVWSMVVGALIGGGGAWWFSRPWIEFNPLIAQYIEGDPAIYVSGTYSVNRECDISKSPIVWRIEALATDGQIALYGPQPVLPDMSRGRHYYQEKLPLLATIRPDGWRTTVLVTCTSASGQQTIASDPAIVQMFNADFPRGGGL
jgi:hypothetical protein